MEIDEIYLTLRALQITDFAAQWQDTAKAKPNILGVFLPKWKKKKKKYFIVLVEKTLSWTRNQHLRSQTLLKASQMRAA